MNKWKMYIDEVQLNKCGSNSQCREQNAAFGVPKYKTGFNKHVCGIQANVPYMQTNPTTYKMQGLRWKGLFLDQQHTSCVDWLNDCAPPYPYNICVLPWASAEGLPLPDALSNIIIFLSGSWIREKRRGNISMCHMKQNTYEPYSLKGRGWGSSRFNELLVCPSPLWANRCVQ